MSGAARRTVVAAAGGAGLAAALTACGAGGTDDKDAAQQGGTLARTGDIPVGGGKVLADKGLVITQPKAGEFKAFSSKCTHQGCAVSGVKDGVIVCPCHQSHFDMSDGSVKAGPATAPLPPEPIQVVGEEISLG
ncbi:MULTISPECIES: Rieske (2Fe-2S) protein [unclassified Streptomyces]|uniref:Rieske (2Fe-2S) protein n=1 Tax=unclassified Streptomyces TaxID=2593676 RepID=UPI0006F20518|nr:MULTISPECIES: Rieske (2Fe-2S) protein [unclassified Streptomyces]KQX57491.1 iron-sulfur protein [Streptomyces sp. Root1304]KRA98863.1 iron-sulfur protein [Streptomyces sp. Root66D1]